MRGHGTETARASAYVCWPLPVFAEPDGGWQWFWRAVRAHFAITAKAAASFEIGAEVERSVRHHHELSIASGLGWCLGSMPGANTSMMIIRPPHEGQGKLRICGCSGSAVASSPTSLIDA
jgi:hypothetical protein